MPLNLLNLAKKFPPPTYEPKTMLNIFSPIGGKESIFWPSLTRLGTFLCGEITVTAFFYPIEEKSIFKPNSIG